MRGAENDPALRTTHFALGLKGALNMPWFLPGVLSNLFGGYATRLHPFQKREPFEGARGHIQFDHSTCSYCGACAKRCPAAAIVVERQTKTLLFEPFRCIVCEACVEVCPKKSVSLHSQYRSPAYVKSTETYREEAVAKA